MRHSASPRCAWLALSFACLTSTAALAQASSDAAATEPAAVVEPAATEPAATEPVATGASEAGAEEASSDAEGAQAEDAAAEDATPDEAVPEEAAPAHKLLVLDLVDRGAGESLTKHLSEAIGVQAGRSSSDVVTAAGLRASLDVVELEMLSGCDAEGCMTSLAGEISATRVLGGSVTLAGADLLITVVLVDVANGARLGEAQRKVRAEPTLAAYAARGLVAQVLAGGATEGAALGEAVPVLIESEPAGARAFLDGEAVGSTPVVVSVMPGSHEVTLRADGFDEQILGLVVSDGAPVVVSASLSQPLVRLWPIAAALGGVAVLSAGGASWAGISAANAYDGSFGMFTPEEDIARSYRYASPIDSVGLAEKQQQVEQLALLSNVLWTATVISVVGAVLVGSADVALWALRE